MIYSDNVRSLHTDSPQHQRVKTESSPSQKISFKMTSLPALPKWVLNSNKHLTSDTTGAGLQSRDSYKTPVKEFILAGESSRKALSTLMAI